MPLGLDVGTLKLVLVAGAVIAAAVFLVAVRLDRRASAELDAPGVEPPLPVAPPVIGPAAEPSRDLAWPLPNVAPPPERTTLLGPDPGLAPWARRLTGGPPPLITRVPVALSPAMQDRAKASGAPSVTGASPAAYHAVRRRRPLRHNRRLLLVLAGAAGLTSLIVLLGLQLLTASAWGTPSGSATAGQAALVPVATPTKGNADPSPLGATPDGTAGNAATSASGNPATPAATAARGGNGITGVSGTGGGNGGPGATPPLTGGQGPTPKPADTPTPRPTPSQTPPPTPSPRSTPPSTPSPTASPAPVSTPSPTPAATQKPPRVSFDWGATGLRVSFENATRNAASWTWDFGDGTTSTMRNPSHTYAAAGSYTVVLSAVSSTGLTASRSKTVTVAP